MLLIANYNIITLISINYSLMHWCCDAIIIDAVDAIDVSDALMLWCVDAFIDSIDAIDALMLWCGHHWCIDALKSL